MITAQRATLALLLAALTTGCLAPTGPRLSVSRCPVPPRALVLVLDGAGGTDVTSRSLDAVVQDQRLPLKIVPYDWSHGWGRIISDQLNVTHLDCQAEEFAKFILVLRSENPGLPLHVLTYSAGSAVVTRAARHLPPHTLERVVFLAPAIAAKSDLRCLLAATRRSVNAFISERDVFFLGIGSFLVGPTGGPRGPAAGRTGFDPVVETPDDMELYRTKLRQYPWVPEYSWTGNFGQHAGGHQLRFMGAYIAPLLLAD